MFCDVQVVILKFWPLCDLTDFRNGLLLFEDICVVIGKAQKKLQSVTSLCEIHTHNLKVFVAYIGGKGQE